MKSICKIFLGMSVNFRDESNEPSLIMIGYSDATVTVFKHPLIVRRRLHYLEQLLQDHSCGGNFVIRLYLLPLISGQSIVSLSSKYFHITTKHGLEDGGKVGPGSSFASTRPSPPERSSGPALNASRSAPSSIVRSPLISERGGSGRSKGERGGFECR